MEKYLVNYCDCGCLLKFDGLVCVLDEYDNKQMVCNKYYCPSCYNEYEINEEIELDGKEE